MSYLRLKTSKKKDAIIFKNYYYQCFRVNKSTTYFKCRETGCHASVTISNATGEVNSFSENHNNHISLSDIEIDIKLAVNEMKETIEKQPNNSILSLYESKEIELSLKYKDKSEEFVKLWPQFHQIDSTLYRSQCF